MRPTDRAKQLDRALVRKLKELGVPPDDIVAFQTRYVRPLLRGLVQVESKAGYPPTTIVPRKRRHIQRKRCKWCGKFYAQYERESDERFLKRKWCSNEHRQLWNREREMRRIEKRYNITLPREGEMADEGVPFRA